LSLFSWAHHLSLDWRFALLLLLLFLFSWTHRLILNWRLVTLMWNYYMTEITALILEIFTAMNLVNQTQPWFRLPKYTEVSWDKPTYGPTTHFGAAPWYQMFLLSMLHDIRCFYCRCQSQAELRVDFRVVPLNQMFLLSVSKPGRIEGRLSSRPFKIRCFYCRCQSQAELRVDFRVVHLNQMFLLSVSKPGRIEGRLSSRPFKSDVSIVGVRARQNWGSTFESSL